MNKRIILVMAVLCLAFSAFAGGENQAAPGGKTELTLQLGSWWDITAKQLEAGFNADNPQYHLTVDLMPINGYQDNAIAGILSGSSPDILDIDMGWVSTFASRDLLEDLSQTIGAKLNKSDFIKAAWNSSMYKDKLYGFPSRAIGPVYYYNKTMFDEAGVPYPTPDWTYDDLLAMARKITVPGQKYGVGIAADSSDPSNVFTSFAPVLWAYGGDFVTPDGKTCLLNRPEAVKAITYWTELYTKHKVVPEGSLNYSISRDVVPLFDQNKCALLPFNVQGLNTFAKNPSLKWGVVLEPMGKSRAAGWTLTIPVSSKNKQGAADFILWFSKPENMAKYTAVEPANIHVWANYAPWNGDLYKDFLTSANNGQSLPAIASWNEVSTIIVTELQNILQQKKTPQQGANDMYAQITPLL
jgi:multiple sugar transport system substrate-binding protein